MNTIETVGYLESDETFTLRKTISLFWVRDVDLRGGHPTQLPRQRQWHWRQRTNIWLVNSMSANIGLKWVPGRTLMEIVLTPEGSHYYTRTPTGSSISDRNSQILHFGQTSLWRWYELSIHMQLAFHSLSPSLPRSPHAHTQCFIHWRLHYWLAY